MSHLNQLLGPKNVKLTLKEKRNKVLFTKQELTVTIRTDRNDKEQESIILFPNGQDLEQSAPAQVAKTILV